MTRCEAGQPFRGEDARGEAAVSLFGGAMGAGCGKSRSLVRSGTLLCLSQLHLVFAVSQRCHITFERPTKRAVREFTAQLTIAA
jgi:hypothetical protein